MIKLVNIKMEYDKKVVLDNINLTVAPGETVAIIGPSGSGKSTLLRLMVGLTKPSAGEIWIENEEISQYKENALNKVRLKMGMVFQYSALFDFLSVGENVAFGLRQHTKLSNKEIQAIVKEKLRVVGLVGKEDFMPNQLSGGMKKRVSLARAIAINPQIILYDEPTAGLDPIMSAKIDKTIMNTQKIIGGVSVVVTHNMASAFAIADRIIMIYEGKIIAEGSTAAIKESDNDIVQKFIGDYKNIKQLVHENEVLEIED
ncbi:MAG: ABC transporter ATP-binding protein [Negativicutes bacterium]|nr:ABC transporter ATP-binding protein [Negativicutes bacterium]MBP9536586.1 ABC transporter ATP-binding protein [Negativicutes bacterium]